ncbi:MAG TPA: PAS domain S-box protein [Candidatus Acidoferrales bacterium]|jgi:two-component system cell cycle sensor histidine kinase/response regulator CckA|nr:PAS domain S-box protein [Candidatus Acidoferrales bacterium]
MGKPINILIAEDSVDDTAFLVDELKTAGFDPTWKRVETEPDFLAELKKGPDIILSDYSMPQFNGLRAAQLAQESGLDVPLILISGTVGEEIAVEAMKRGATDYLLKDRIGRLGSAVERALEQKRLRVERKQTEQQIHLQASALEAAANAILITDRQGKILSANTAFCTMTGYPPEEVLGQAPRLLKSGEHEPDFYKQLWQTVCAGHIWRGDITNRRKNGTLYQEEMIITPVRAANGEITHFIAIKQDITGRKQAEAALARLAAIVESSDDAIIGKDLNGVITSWNKSAERLFGYSADEMVGTSILRLIPAGRDGEEHQILSKIRRGESLEHLETVRQAKDGRLIDVSVTASPIKDAAGKVIGVSKVARDITGRKKAENALRKVSSQESGLKKARILRDFAVIIGLCLLAYAILDYTEVLERPLENLVLKFKGNLDDLFGPVAVLLLGCFIFSYRRWRDTQSRVSEQANIEGALRILHGELENRIQQRTAELAKTNDALHLEIAERKRAEDALAQLNRRHELILNSVAEGIHGIDFHGNIMFENAAAAKMFGSEADALVGKPAHALMHHTRADGSPYPVEQCPIYATLHDGVSRRIDNEVFWRKDGTSFPVEYVAAPNRDKGGAIVGTVVTFRDITERKQAEEALRESEGKFRQLAENITVVFWITNAAKDRMIYISPAYEKIWGRTCESLYQSPQTWLDAIHPEDRDRVVEAATTKQERGDYDEIYRIKRPDGSIRRIRDRAFPVRNAAGEIYRIAGTAEDITERRLLEEQLRQAQKMEAIGQLAGGVAHDFNNILAVIQLQADMLRTEPNISVEQQDYASEIEKSAQRAANLTRQLLLFSRQQTLQPRDLNLNDVIANITKMLHRVLGEDIQMQFKYAAKPLMMHADPGMIDQILMNLTVNARDAMPEGGQLIVETAAVEFDELAKTYSPQARPGSFACLSVSDTGCGIPPEVLPRIFEPFFTTKEVGKGTGLGLATVFGIVQQHQGWINVYTEPGEGTTFRIYLPRLTQTADIKASGAPAAPVRGGNETILLVEDDRSLRAALRIALSRLGYRVLEATTGPEALEAWRQHSDAIQLVLTDMIMPGGMNGRELAQQLVAKNPKLKVVYASGYSDKIASKDLVLEEGVNFLIKPFEAHKLAQTVRNCLDGVKAAGG